ncbi:MAG TPA: PAS domain S-box protein, partial [Dehalococcoidia bacterium]|nr:PAS domain S-box protein [Dehalococcoidia bacterium]
MGTPLRVLVVEDSEDDTVLMLRELRGGGYEPTHERVDTAAAMTEALGREKWDVILADYVMPRFSAAAALTLLKESRLDLPFIIVTGTVGEEIVVAAMKAGAHDYLFKGNLARLFPAVERELRDAEVRRARRRAEEALRKTNETLQALVQASPVGIAILDPDGRVEMWNPAAERMFGWSADEVLGRPLPTIPDGKEEEHRALRERVLKGGASSGVEVQRRAKDGLLLDISLSTAPLRDLDGSISGIVGMMADITERKRAEETLREREGWLSTTMSSIGDAVMATDTEGRVTFLNPAAQSLTGWSQEEAVGRPLGAVFKVVSEDTGRPLDDLVTKVMQEG